MDHLWSECTVSQVYWGLHFTSYPLCLLQTTTWFYCNTDSVKKFAFLFQPSSGSVTELNIHFLFNNILLSQVLSLLTNMGPLTQNYTQWMSGARRQQRRGGRRDHRQKKQSWVSVHFSKLQKSTDSDYILYLFPICCSKHTVAYCRKQTVENSCYICRRKLSMPIFSMHLSFA